jgi:hypothetical protein
MRPCPDALKRRRNRRAWPQRAALLAAVLAITAFGHAQAAQTPTEAAPGTAPEKPDHGTNKAPDITTSETPGVLKPKVNPDPGISLPTPDPKQFPTPVIKPPEVKGNNTQIVPK